MKNSKLQFWTLSLSTWVCFANLTFCDRISECLKELEPILSIKNLSELEDKIGQPTYTENGKLIWWIFEPNNGPFYFLRAIVSGEIVQSINIESEPFELAVIREDKRDTTQFEILEGSVEVPTSASRDWKIVDVNGLVPYVWEDGRSGKVEEVSSLARSATAFISENGKYLAGTIGDSESPVNAYLLIGRDMQTVMHSELEDTLYVSCVSNKGIIGGDLGNHPILWKCGEIIPLDLPDGYLLGKVKGVSTDGNIWIGTVAVDEKIPFAVYWKEGKPQIIGQGTAINVSGDGSVVTGVYVKEANDSRLTWFWVYNRGNHQTLKIPGDPSHGDWISGISNDGKRLVGTFNRRATLWCKGEDGKYEAEELDERLSRYGKSIVKLVSANFISGDGKFVVGHTEDRTLFRMKIE